MSYDLGIYVKMADMPNKFILVGEPERSNPTYNLGKIFRTSMDWNYNMDDAYNAEFVLEKIDKGLKELHQNCIKYRKFEPENHFGTVEWAIETLSLLRDKILEVSKEEYIPIKYLYVGWGDLRCKHLTDKEKADGK